MSEPYVSNPRSLAALRAAGFVIDHAHENYIFIFTTPAKLVQDARALLSFLRVTVASCDKPFIQAEFDPLDETCRLSLELSDEELYSDTWTGLY